MYSARTIKSWTSTMPSPEGVSSSTESPIVRGKTLAGETRGGAVVGMTAGRQQE